MIELGSECRCLSARSRLVHLVTYGRFAFLSSEFFRYGYVSAAALAVDWGLLVSLTEFVGLNYMLSAAVGFCAGLVICYSLSVAFVFRERRFEDIGAEFALFCLTGVLGLIVNEVLMHVIVSFGFGYAFAKAPTAIVTFLLNFVTRRILLFSKWRIKRLWPRDDDLGVLGTCECIGGPRSPRAATLPCSESDP